MATVNWLWQQFLIGIAGFCAAMAFQKICNFFCDKPHCDHADCKKVPPQPEGLEG